MADKTGKQPLVLLFRGSLCEMSRREFSGIMRYVHDAQWKVQTVEYASAAGNRFRAAGGDDLDVARLLDFWKPSGCIVECMGQASKFPQRLFGRTPVVFLDSYPELMGRNSLCVSSDADRIAEVAARELLRLDFADYAYVPWPDDTLWSRGRGIAFERLVALNGRRFHRYDGHAKIADVMAYDRELSAWLSTLPRPCGVFAANDCVARRVLEACGTVGIPVPDELAIIGVDDDEDLCENASVSLSSVRADSEASGFSAAGLLDRRMRRPRARLVSVVCGAPVLVRRASTRRYACGDGRVVRALEHIRLHACEGIGRPDVIAVMGCSPRLADIRFRETTGHSILDEIHGVRLEKAKLLLGSARPDLARIASACGYASLDDFRRVFRRYLGTTPSKWAK